MDAAHQQHLPLAHIHSGSLQWWSLLATLEACMSPAVIMVCRMIKLWHWRIITYFFQGVNGLAIYFFIVEKFSKKTHRNLCSLHLRQPWHRLGTWNNLLAPKQYFHFAQGPRKKNAQKRKRWPPRWPVGHWRGPGWMGLNPSYPWPVAARWQTCGYNGLHSENVWSIFRSLGTNYPSHGRRPQQGSWCESPQGGNSQFVCQEQTGQVRGTWRCDWREYDYPKNVWVREDEGEKGRSFCSWLAALFDQLLEKFNCFHLFPFFWIIKKMMICVRFCSLEFFSI